MQNKIKIWFDLEKSDWHTQSSESMWCYKNGNKNTALLGNIPLYAYNLSIGDSISYKIDDEGIPIFIKILEKSGNSTYRIISFDNYESKRFNELIEEMKKEGCSFESNGKFLYGIDIPKNTKIDKIYSILEKGENEGVWDFEESDFNN